MIKLERAIAVGMMLALVDGKNIIPLGKMDAVAKPPKNDKDTSGLVLHFVQGNQWTGEPIAELPDGRVLCIKGSIYSRKSSTAQPTGSVGSVI